MMYPFFIETNATWGDVTSDNDWSIHVGNVQKLYGYSKDDAEQHLLKSKVLPSSLEGILSFGLYPEYNGHFTLEEWQNQNINEPQLTKYKDFYIIYKKIEDRVKKIWEKRGIKSHDSPRIVEIDEGGITFEYYVYCWGECTKRDYIPYSEIDSKQED